MKKFNILCLAAALTAPLLTGCSGSDAPDEPSVPESGSYTITLVAKDGAMNSRALDADPTVGTQPSSSNEGKIYNVTLLLYRKSLNDNTITDTQYNIEYTLYYDDFSSSAETSQTITINKVLIGTYYITALVNAYESESAALEAWPSSKTLADLKAAVFSGTPPYQNWYNNDNHTTFTKFVMTSDKEAMMNFSSTTPTLKDSEGNTITYIPVERLAARVDLQIQGLIEPSDGETDYKAIIYRCNEKGEPTIEDNDYVETANRMTISKISLLNINQKDTYLIQRSADKAENNTNLKYFQDEVFSQYNNTDYYYGTKYVKSSTTSSSDLTADNLPWTPASLFTAYHKLDQAGDYYTITYIGEFTNYDATTNAQLEITYSYTTDLSNSVTTRTFTLPIRHCLPSSSVTEAQPMEYAVIRNTVYRFNLRFFTDDTLIYVRWYYYSGSGNSLTQTDYGAAIDSVIKESGDNPTITD